MKKIIELKILWEDGSYLRTTDRDFLMQVLRMIKKREKLLVDSQPNGEKREEV